MYGNRYRLRKRFLIPVALVILTFTLVVINSNGFLLRLYDYPINFHGVPGGYLSTRTPKNESYCNFKYGLPEELLYEDSDLTYPLEEKSKSSYRVLLNVIQAKHNAKLPKLTYATHITANFVNYIAELVRFWEGPISVAAFVPDYDADLTITQLSQLCSCVSEMRRVSVHFIFPSTSPPYLQNHPDKLNTCEPVDSSKLSTFKSSSGLIYPINVCRNIARNYAQTEYVMVTDIELIPSEGLASRFLKMVKKFKFEKLPSRVYVVPVFEVEAFDVIPRTKNELTMMIKEERAVYFHRYICSHCQKFPGVQTWIETNTGKDIRPFVSVKREYPFHRWEPIFIGTKNEPLYSEALSWEGLQDKMTQMLEMCLIGYQFIILDGAFLVHWPGIKKEKHSTILGNYWRTQFQKENSLHYAQIIKNFSKRYKNNPQCKIK